ncbi:hypothetical protein, partial [Frankia sp. Cas3]|uniref:hypothetical protein n=1 Tax=Frankia sp. Cas3 TaxID=3073926 RepID=UPI002AD55BEA
DPQPRGDLPDRLTPSEPLGRGHPDLFPTIPFPGGQPATRRIPHTSRLPEPPTSHPMITTQQTIIARPHDFAD